MARGRGGLDCGVGGKNNLEVEYEQESRKSTLLNSYVLSNNN